MKVDLTVLRTSTMVISRNSDRQVDPTRSALRSADGREGKDGTGGAAQGMYGV